jgi:hypothetical protein
MSIEISAMELPRTSVLPLWVGVTFGIVFATCSLYRAVSVGSAARVLETVYKANRDRSKDAARIKEIRIAAFLAFLGGAVVSVEDSCV